MSIDTCGTFRECGAQCTVHDHRGTRHRLRCPQGAPHCSAVPRVPPDALRCRCSPLREQLCITRPYDDQGTTPETAGCPGVNPCTQEKLATLGTADAAHQAQPRVGRKQPIRDAQVGTGHVQAHAQVEQDEEAPAPMAAPGQNVVHQVGGVVRAQGPPVVDTALQKYAASAPGQQAGQPSAAPRGWSGRLQQDAQAAQCSAQGSGGPPLRQQQHHFLLQRGQRIGNRVASHASRRAQWRLPACKSQVCAIGVWLCDPPPPSHVPIITTSGHAGDCPNSGHEKTNLGLCFFAYKVIEVW